MGSIARLAINFVGRGRLEGHPPGDLDGVRFEGRFVIYGMTGDKGPLFGEDVSLFDKACVAQHGRGPQSAHFVSMRSGYVLEGFDTHQGEFLGHSVGRTSSNTRLRVYFDAKPDGSRNFDDRATFMRGELIATYQAEEFFQIDPQSGTFFTRVNYSLIESKPFTHLGQTVDFAELAPQMAEIAHGHNPEDDPEPELVPYDDEVFSNRGPGEFAQRFSVGGSLLAVG